MNLRGCNKSGWAFRAVLRRSRVLLGEINGKDSIARGRTLPNTAYIDSAIQIAEISLTEGNLRLRVSTYETPGCLGHMASAYILDLLQGNSVLRKLEVDRIRGVL